jgi:SHAQKYF class myb-like DNA-binding protein
MDSDDDSRLRGPHERGVWSKAEHDKFLAAVALHPHGPWKTIAALVGTRSVRQVQTHAQKYHEKVNRRARGLQKNRQKVTRLEHRVDDAAQDFLARPRGGKGQKRGKYNKRNRDARVAPIPPRPRVALPPPVSPSGSRSRSQSPRREELQVDTTSSLPAPPPPVVAGEDDLLLEEKAVAPLPSPNEVGSSTFFQSAPSIAPSAVVASPPADLLLGGDELFSLSVDLDPAASFLAARPTTPSPLVALPASPAALSPEAIDRMLYDDMIAAEDDIVAVEEAPEHALSMGEVPSLNDALDYFLKVMNVWGPRRE